MNSLPFIFIALLTKYSPIAALVAMVILLIIVYEIDIDRLPLFKKKNVEENANDYLPFDKADKTEYYNKISNAYATRKNIQQNYDFLENLPPDMVESNVDYKTDKRLNQGVFCKLFVIYVTYGMILFGMKYDSPSEAGIFAPLIITLFSPAVLGGFLFKSKHQNRIEKGITFIVALIPMLFAGISYCLSIAKENNYEYLQNIFLAVVLVITFILFMNLIKFEFRNK